MSNIKKNTINGAKWSFLRKFTVQPVQLIYGMVLARFISPTEMGILGLTSIFFSIASTLADSGFGTALIRKQNKSEADINTVFWFNLAISAVMSTTLFLLAPWFSSFYNQPQLLWLTRVSAIMMLIMSSISVHLSLFQCRLDFKTPAIIGMVSTFSSMPVCLYFAWKGWGVWALMLQNVVSSLVTLILVWHFSPWKPIFVFSTTSFKDFFGFGSKLAISNLLNVVYVELRTFIIGKFYSPAQLGLYSRGRALASLAPTTITGILHNITFPILVKIQDNNDKLSHIYRKYIKCTSLVIMWISVILLILAQPIVYIVYGENWINCSIYIQILCLVYTFDHINIINSSLITVKGMASALLKLDIIKKIISTSILLYCATISVEAICWGMVIYTQIALLINSCYTKWLIGLGWWKQQKDYLPYYLLAAACSIPAFLLTLTELHAVWQILIGGSSSLLLYVGILYTFKESAFMELFALVCKKIKRV